MTAVFEFRNGSIVKRRLELDGVAEFKRYVAKAVAWTRKATDRSAYVYAYPGYKSRSVEKMLADLSVPF